MKILAIDIGAGTQDILLYDDGKTSIENCIKMVLPSPTIVFATKIREATKLGQNLFINGDVIGGGSLNSALKNHIEKGFNVVMTKNTAYTVRNDLGEVLDLGIKIVDQDKSINYYGKTLTIKEINLNELNEFLAYFNEDLSDIDIVAIAVQDHGVFPKGTSNRKFRIQKMKELLENDSRPESLAFKENEIPQYLLRMRSAAKASRRQLPKSKVLIMDTSPAAILGCLEDASVQEKEAILAINVGNGHTMAAIIEEGKISGIMEHHTSLLNPQKINELLIDFADGKLSDEEVFEDGGHGLFFIKQPPRFSKINRVIVTGPNRSIVSNTTFPVRFATPAGDVMMTGPIGLICAAKRRFKLAS